MFMPNIFYFHPVLFLRVVKILPCHTRIYLIELSFLDIFRSSFNYYEEIIEEQSLFNSAKNRFELIA